VDGTTVPEGTRERAERLRDARDVDILVENEMKCMGFSS
jgi:hypothetical protein